MTDPFFEAREEVERLRQDAHQAANEATEFATWLQSREYTGHSRRREVTVRVGTDGLVRDIAFARSAPSTTPARLGPCSPCAMQSTNSRRSRSRTPPTSPGSPPPSITRGCPHAWISPQTRTAPTSGEFTSTQTTFLDLGARRSVLVAAATIAGAAAAVTWTTSQPRTVQLLALAGVGPRAGRALLRRWARGSAPRPCTAASPRRGGGGPPRGDMPSPVTSPPRTRRPSSCSYPAAGTSPSPSPRCAAPSAAVRWSRRRGNSGRWRRRSGRPPTTRSSSSRRTPAAIGAPSTLKDGGVRTPRVARASGTLSSGRRTPRSTVARRIRSPDPR